MQSLNQALSQSLHKANSLKKVLSSEFEALKEQNLTKFEELQIQKSEIFTFFSQDSLFDQIKTRAGAGDSQEYPIDVWDEVMDILKECKTLHQRNEILINSKLDSIRSALATIQSKDPLSSVEIYDKLGKLKSSRSNNNFSDA
jgi:flagellar biosynthesis/type III secretory pathway chaperone